MHTIHQFTVADIDGTAVRLERFKGQVLLIVNVASFCKFTPQYRDLQALYDKYREQGFSVLAFPCNQFMRQETGDARQIKNFCASNYQITFPLFAKINVNGVTAHPLYQFLRQEKPGFLGTRAIKWNFTKFLVDRRGEVRQRFAPCTAPEEIEEPIKRLLQNAE